MRRSAHRAVLGIAFAAYSALSLGQEVECPTWAPNDTWTYQRWELPGVGDGGGRLPSHRRITILAVRPKQYIANNLTWQDYALKETKSEEARYSRAQNWYFRESASLPWTEHEFLRWPLVVGKSWDFTHPMPDGSKFEWHVAISGWEEVSVPAGRFKAIVIKVEGAAGAHYTQSRTFWYSPDAKTVVKKEFRGYWLAHKDYGELEELESFSVK